jgi:hypothetical protein
MVFGLRKSKFLFFLDGKKINFFVFCSNLCTHPVEIELHSEWCKKRKNITFKVQIALIKS